ncbi:hypothetical protein C7T94_03035 [Pedobacter yulinensis]|uniref:Uncharacterized protein n=1 Tax=Pedobacter yulinensis TaxID=2126353 RepID=A0A2T3HRN0_9SPHI|nr:hypothetical protein C7T94_03035 [Pedobacter yulinensis]
MRSYQKKALFLAVFYALSVLGFAAGLHFCGGKLSEVKLFASAEGCNMCKKAAEKSDGCCKTTKVEVQVKDSHQAGLSVKMPQLFGLDLFYIPAFADFVTRVEAETSAASANKAPPLASRLSLNILFQIFRN